MVLLVFSLLLGTWGLLAVASARTRVAARLSGFLVIG